VAKDGHCRYDAMSCILTIFKWKFSLLLESKSPRASHRVASHRISSHRISSHRISSRLIAQAHPFSDLLPGSLFPPEASAVNHRHTCLNPMPRHQLAPRRRVHMLSPDVPHDIIARCHKPTRTPSNTPDSLSTSCTLLHSSSLHRPCIVSFHLAFHPSIHPSEPRIAA
jgi:hypothetical protein